MKFKPKWNINTILLIIIIVLLITIIAILLDFRYYFFKEDGVWKILESIYYTSNVFPSI